MLYVSWCILYVSYMYPKPRMEYIRIHTEYTMIHVSTPSHMARPVRLWDTPGYNRIQQNTSARAYPHRLRLRISQTGIESCGLRFACAVIHAFYIDCESHRHWIVRTKICVCRYSRLREVRFKPTRNRELRGLTLCVNLTEMKFTLSRLWIMHNHKSQSNEV